MSYCYRTWESGTTQPVAMARQWPIFGRLGRALTQPSGLRANSVGDQRDRYGNRTKPFTQAPSAAVAEDRRPLCDRTDFYFCVYMTFIYMPFDLFVKPVAEDHDLVRVCVNWLVGEGHSPSALADLRLGCLWVSPEALMGHGQASTLPKW